jgi:hypothetical protein
MTSGPVMALFAVTILTWGIAIWASYDENSGQGSGRVA